MSAFGIDIDKLIAISNGDVGIADAIREAQISPITAAINVPDDKETFQKLSVPDKRTGMHAAERTIISSMIETQKPFIEMVKISLELFGAMEYMTTVFNGGFNPENDPTSFSSVYDKSKPKFAQFKTGFEPDADTNVSPSAPKPKKLYLGTWRRGSVGSGDFGLKGPNGNDLTGAFSIDNGAWPQWREESDYRSAALQEMEQKMTGLPEPFKNMIRDARSASFPTEWDEIKKENLLIKGYENLINDTNLFYAYRTVTVNYLGNLVEVDVEGDYSINVARTFSNNINNTFEEITITANLNDDPSSDPGSQLKRPLLFTGGQKKIPTIKAFLNRVLPVMIKKFVPVLSKFKKIFDGPVDFVGDILMTKLKEHFQMFDLSLKDRGPFDPERGKYWSEDKFVLDGKVALDVGLLKITLGVLSAVPSFAVGKEDLPPDNTENPILKMIANIAALPINFLKGILDFFTGMITKVFTIFQIPSLIIETLSFDWVKDLLSLEKILELVGAVNGDVTQIPMLNVPKDGAIELVPQMLQAFLKMITRFFNGFIDIINAIIGIKAVPTLPIP